MVAMPVGLFGLMPQEIQNQILEMSVGHFENESVLSFLKNNIVMVGLNISRRGSTGSKPFQNFHSPNSSANDFKIRYVFQKDSPYYGAYMTDIIKLHEKIDAKQVMR
jgi:hypothetical protein